jgi:membrane protease YdiL (CAAX protease family)
VAVLDVVLGVVQDRTGSDRNAQDTWNGMLFGNLLLASSIPVVLTAMTVFGRRVGRVSSVAGRLRWRWLLWCFPLAAGGMAVSYAVSTVVTLVAGGDDTAVTPEADWLGLVVVVLLTTPLQAAGEEYLFRGWIPQLVGTAIPSARVGALLGGLISSALFVLAHGSSDAWVVADLLLFAVIASWLTWRTGGLEASIALHVVNNVVIFGVSVVTSDVAEAATQDVDFTWWSFLTAEISPVLGMVFILLLARRRRVQRLTAPRVLTPAGPPPA